MFIYFYVDETSLFAKSLWKRLAVIWCSANELKNIYLN